MRSPVLSIVVPVHNTPCEALHACLSSLHLPYEPRLEIIVVDDGSDERGQHVLRESIDEIGLRCLYHHHAKALGANRARSEGVEHAHGRYIYFVDSDDVVFTDNLVATIDLLETTRPDLLVIHSQVQLEGGTVIDHAYEWAELTGEQRTRAYLAGIDTFWSQILSRALLVSDRGRLYADTSIGEDLASLLPIATHVADIGFSKLPLYLHISRSDGVLSAMQRGQTGDIIQVVKHLAVCERECPSKWKEEVEWAAIKHGLYYGLINAVRAGCRKRSELVRYYRCLNLLFPQWRTNRYIRCSAYAHKMSFRLIIHGHWRLFSAMYLLRQVLIGSMKH